MTVPTRIIEREEFERLAREQAAEEGDVLFVHKVVPINYATDNDGHLTTTNIPGMLLLFVNTVEPLIYKDVENKRVMILVNAYEEWTYEMIRDLHPHRDADMYCLAPAEWQADDWDYPMDFATYFFRDDDKKYGKVDIENIAPLDERMHH